jgi:predicted methyltransferase
MTMRNTLIIAAVVLLAGCGEPAQQDAPAETPAAAIDAVVDSTPNYKAAVSNSARSEADRERDASRKPAEVLEFFGIKPGMRVLDMFSGGGYYTEILSYVVGPDGMVVAHSNEAYAGFVGDEAITRYANDRLSNTEILMAENNELQLEADQFDAIMLVLSFHDIFYDDPKNGWPKINGPKFLTELHGALKPGAVIGIVDHYAAAGSPRETGTTLHRIDPAIVVADMQAAGFVLDGQSELLRNTDDDYSVNMFDPAVRGKTDRFVMRFVKPAS